MASAVRGGLRLVTLSVVWTLLFAACSAPAAPPAAAPAAASPAAAAPAGAGQATGATPAPKAAGDQAVGGEIKIGSVMPLTGEQAAIAKSYADGYRAYFGAVNDAGGVNGKKINWLIEDDGMQAARSIAGIRKLVQQDKVVLLTATYGTGNTLQMLPAIDEAKIPLVAPIAFATQLYRPVRPLVFTVWPGFGDIYPLMTEHLRSTGSKRFALLYRNDPSGEEAVAGYSKNLSSGEMLAKAGFEPNTTDFTTIVQRLLADKPDTLVVYGAANELAKAVAALRAQQFTGRIADSLVTADANFVKLAGPDVPLDGVLGQTLQDFSGNARGWKEYEANVKKYAPDANPAAAFTLTGYINAIVVAETLKRAGNDLSPEGIRSAAEGISNLDTGGLSGTISFSATKHVGTDSAQITEIKGGKVGPITEFLKIPTS